MGAIDDAERAYARAVRALLQGRAPPAPADALPGPADAALDERAASDDDDDALVLRARRQLAALPERVRRAVDAEAAPVLLADGSRLTLDQAERLLANKEERAAHRTLRALVDASVSPFRQFEIHRSDARHAATTTATALEAFLVDTRGLRDAALDALGTVGGECPTDAPSIARALDLPDGDGAFGEATLLALLAAARHAARPARKVSRVRAPRAMSGAVFDDGDDVRFAHPPAIARYRRFARTLTAGVHALVVARGPTPARRSGDDAALAGALHLGLLAAGATRRVTAASRAHGDRIARVAVATGLLCVRAQVRLALSAEPDEAREGLVDALGVDPGAALLAELARPAWTCFDDPCTRALSSIRAAAIALALRDTLDESYALEPATWNEGPSIAAHLLDAPLDEHTIARGWLGLAGELL